MKTIYTYFSFVIIYFGNQQFIFSQSYQKFLYANNEWDVYTDAVPVKTYSNQAFQSGPVFAIEDTLVSGLIYKKAFSRSEDSNWPANKPCLIREDTLSKKVFILSVDSINERILYDFSLVTGDSIYLEYRYENSFQQVLKSGWYYVDSTGSVSTISGIRNTWFLRNPLIASPFPNVPQLTWVEGIGSDISPLYLDEEFTYSFTSFNFNPNAQYYFSLTCAFHDSLAVFHDSAWAVFFPQYSFQLGGDSCTFNFLGGVSEIGNELKPLIIQPNPIEERAEISITGSILHKKGKYRLSVFDPIGKKTYEFSISANQISKGYSFHKGTMQAGIYFMYLSEDERIVATGKLIVQ